MWPEAVSTVIGALPLGARLAFPSLPTASPPRDVCTLPIATTAGSVGTTRRAPRTSRTERGNYGKTSSVAPAGTQKGGTVCQAGVLVVAVAAGVEAVGVLVALSRRHGRAQHQRQDPRQIRGHRSRLFTIDLLWWYRSGL